MIFARRPERYRRLLIIEDEPLIAFDNEHALTDAGHEIVATVDNIADAVAVLEAGGIDLVLADIRLADGEEGGIEVARHAHSRRVPVLFVTGSALPETARRFGIGLFAKPYTVDRLRAAIDALERDDKRKPPKGLTLF